MNFLALGDSYTIGEGVLPHQRWPTALLTQLHEEGLFFQQLEIIARTGWTTSELLEGLRIAPLAPPYSIVALLIGVNNQYRGLSIHKYTNELNQLIDKTIDYTGGYPERTLVLSIPDWGVSPFASERDHLQIAQDIDRYNSINEKAALNRSCSWLNLTDLSRTLTEGTYFALDGLHPSSLAYQKWTRHIGPAIKQILGFPEGIT